MPWQCWTIPKLMLTESTHFQSSSFSLWQWINLTNSVAQITQCTSSISHNAPFCNRNVHTHVDISVTKWCIVGYGTGALCDLCNRSHFIVNPIISLWSSDAYMHTMPSLFQIMACGLFSAKPLSEPMLPYCELGHKEKIKMIFFKSNDQFNKIYLKLLSAK